MRHPSARSVPSQSAAGRATPRRESPDVLRRFNTGRARDSTILVRDPKAPDCGRTVQSRRAWDKGRRAGRPPFRPRAMMLASASRCTKDTAAAGTDSTRARKVSRSRTDSAAAHHHSGSGGLRQRTPCVSSCRHGRATRRGAVTDPDHGLTPPVRLAGPESHRKAVPTRVGWFNLEPSRPKWNAILSTGIPTATPPPARR